MTRIFTTLLTTTMLAGAPALAATDTADTSSAGNNICENAFNWGDTDENAKLTRAEIEDIRGVSLSSSIMKTLHEREWIRIAGHKELPGRPAVYATTKAFLDHFNLASLGELPPIEELRDIVEVHPELDLTLGDEAAPAEGAEAAEAGAAADRAAEDGTGSSSGPSGPTLH